MMLLLVLASFMLAQEPARNGPRIFFESDFFDAGTVKQFEVVEHAFPFTNTGNETLVITKVSSGCGCTQTSTTATEIPPGETAFIKISYTTDLESGDKLKPAYVSTNVPGEGARRLDLKANVIPALACDPTLIDFGALESGVSLTQKAVLHGYALKEVKILKVLCENPNIKAELVDGGKALSITLLPGLKVGKLSERIRFETDSKKFQILPAVTVSAKILGALEASPQLVDFEAFGSDGAVQTKEVIVRTRGKQPFKIHSVTVLKAQIDAAVVELEKGRAYKIVFSTATDFRTAKALVKTDDPHQPELQITLFGKRK